jgi:N-acetylmuramoyl-L-alanine amidase
MSRSHFPIRVAVVLTMVAALLVPAFTNPARAITVPETLARTVTSSGRGDASFAFPATHLAFSWRGAEGTGVCYRVQKDDGSMSRWRTAAESHDMAYENHHFSGVLAVDRPDLVEWKPINPKDLPMGEITVDYLNTMDGPRRRVEVPALAGAAATEPDVISRAEWGANESIKKTSGGCKRLFYPLKQLFVHHTVGTNNDPHPKATMRSMYYFHTVTRGWCDLGYNFVIAPDGRIFEGRWTRRFNAWEVRDEENSADMAVQGAHTENYNSGSVAVSLMGNYSTTTMSSKMRQTLIGFLAWEVDRHNLKPKGTHMYRNPSTGLTRRLRVIAGHRDAGSTECPGNTVYRSLPGLRDAVKEQVADGKSSTETTLTATQPVVPRGSIATYTGRLSTGRGVGIAGKPILVHVRPRNGTWSHQYLAVTKADGTFSFNQTPQKRLTIIAEFEGDGGLWRSQSEKVIQKVVAR